MIKWLILGICAIIATIFVIIIIKIMLKTEKDSNKRQTSETPKKDEVYSPKEIAVDTHSDVMNTPVADFSNEPSKLQHSSDLLDDVPDMPFGQFTDDLDDDFLDYSKFAHNSKGRRRKPPMDFDLDGDLADEYIPDSPEFSYIPRRRKSSTKEEPVSINDLPTEIKVLMLSDIFDKKF